MLAKSLRFVRATIPKLSMVIFFTLFSLFGGTWFASTASSAAPADVSCETVESGKIYRFIEGKDKCLEPISNSELENLNDPFAENILREGKYPVTTDEINNAIKEQLGYDPTIYFAGEGAQIPTSAASRDLPRGLRYIITWGKDENDSKIMLAKLSPAFNETTALGLIELLSYDPQSKEYDYYFLTPQQGCGYDSQECPYAWAWTGKTSNAQNPETIGQGCFRCHHNGTPIMREIELPWSNWQSQRANISSEFIPEEVASETYFLARRGAEVFEQVIRANFQTYYKNWIKERYQKEDGVIKLSDVDEMLRHVITNTTVNFKSSDVQSREKDASGDSIEVVSGIPPNDTFLADTLLQTTLKLDYDTLSVKFPRKKYERYLRLHEYKLVGTKGFLRDSEKAYEYPGSTYFSFYVPQMGAEDIYVTQTLLRAKILTDKFVASLLMVDFKNPLFSKKRASLEKYAKEVPYGVISNGASSVPDDFAFILSRGNPEPCDPKNFDACSAESQFLYTWDLPDDEWRQVTAKRLQDYVDSIENLKENKRLYRVMGWSIKQRDRFAHTLPYCNFFESRLLFPETNVSELASCPTPH